MVVFYGVINVNAFLKITAGAAGFIAVTAAGYMPFVINEALKQNEDDCDCLILLGGDIIGADTPAPQTLERMKKGAEYLKNHPNAYCVTCGGCFRKEQKKSESAIMADYLIANGIEPERIMLEDKSTTTFENFDFALPIIEEKLGKKDLRLALLTSSYHVFRARAIASMCGIKNIGKVSAPTPGKAAKRFVREYFVAYQLPIEFAKRKITKK